VFFLFYFIILMSKVAVIIGVGPGIGAAVASRFAKGGLTVALIARDLEKLKTIELEITKEGGKAFSIQADTSQELQIKNAFQVIRQQLGEVSVLVYNVGASFKSKSALDLTTEEMLQAFNVQVIGALVSCQQVLPKMLEVHSGTILFTGATAQLRGSAKTAAFAVPKFGLRALAQSLAREFQPQGIHVCIINVDGVVDTPVVRKSYPQLTTEQILNPISIAETYFHLYSQDKSAWTHELDLRPFVEKW